MIVDDSYIMCVAVLPAKTCAPLIVDANAPLPFPIARQFFQPVPRWDTQIISPSMSRWYGATYRPLTRLPRRMTAQERDGLRHIFPITLTVLHSAASMRRSASRITANESVPEAFSAVSLNPH